MRARRLLTSFAEQMGDHDDVRRNVEMMRRAWAREPPLACAYRWPLPRPGPLGPSPSSRVARRTGWGGSGPGGSAKIAP